MLLSNTSCDVRKSEHVLVHRLQISYIVPSIEGQLSPIATATATRKPPFVVVPPQPPLKPRKPRRRPISSLSPSSGPCAFCHKNIAFDFLNSRFDFFLPCFLHHRSIIDDPLVVLDYVSGLNHLDQTFLQPTSQFSVCRISVSNVTILVKPPVQLIFKYSP